LSATFASPDSGNHRVRRGIAIIPSLFTVANLSLGYYAVLATLNGTSQGFNDAARAIGLAILFDALDGRIARATGTNSEFGKQFDSLADVISFGVAPAFLAFTWGARSFATHDPGLTRNVYWFGILVTAVFLTCCAWRLARFNIQGMAAGTESKYFVGLPTPAAAGMVAATVHLLKERVLNWQFSVAWMLLVALLSWLMTSTIRYSGFKNINLTRRRSALLVIPTVIIIWLIVLFSEKVLFLLASIYVLSGIVFQLVRHLRRPPASA
jgi:CDP-diacylglycerol--serine O-phosphatidyltransferase